MASSQAGMLETLHSYMNARLNEGIVKAKAEEKRGFKYWSDKWL
jgi:hypothetical protein